MRPTDENLNSPAFTGTSSPFIFDPDVDSQLQEIELKFFDDAVAHTTPTSGVRIFDEFFSSPSENQGIIEPAPDPISLTRARKQVHLQPPVDPNHIVQAYSGSLSNSPSTSSPGSSSGSSRRLDQTVSDQGSSARPKDVVMAGHDPTMDWTTANGDDTLFGLDDTALPPLDPLTDPLSNDADFTMSNQAMANDFDFDSAGSSPSPFGLAMPTNTSVRSGPTPMAFRSPGLDSPATQTKSASPRMFYFQSRENSPLSAMLPTQDQSPSNFWNNNSPSSSLEETFNGITMNGNSPQTQTLQANMGFNGNGFTNGMSDSTTTPSTFGKDLSSPPSTVNSENGIASMLTINPTPLKSRVETQIPIVMTLFPLPQGASKLHLPAHTISKPKLLAKPPPERSPDTLELSTSLVCTSAMQDPSLLSKAFARARGEEVPRSSDSGSRKSPEEGSPSAEDDEDKPLQGTEVKICQGCVLRERKRAARKKLKKVEEEESWQKDEEKRVIVFNTHEVKDWSEPSKENPGLGEQTMPQVPPGAMHVTLPMRIACYCRHQNEKLGFQVIFTIKDHKGKVIAQQITNSIMITDDHKTHPPPQPMAPPSSALPDGTHLPGAGVFSSGPGPSLDMPSATLGPQPVRLSHSTTDLQGLQHNFNPQLPMVPQPFAMPQNVSNSSSSTLTPRNLSRQASPTGFAGPSSKRRKHSGSGKVPSGLTMTRIETAQRPHQGLQAGSATAPPSAATSPYPMPNMNTIPQYSNPLASTAYNASPPTPNSNDNSYFSAVNRSQSMENLPLQQWLSAPSSAHASRPGSPNASRTNLQDPAQFAQALNSQFWGNSMNNTSNRPPIIHKLIPSEGSVSGGTEVTLLGSGFYQGLEVCFGDSLATTTTYWGKKCLHCLTPPAVRPGNVQVLFKQDHPQFGQMQTHSPMVPKQQILFTYTDDREQEMMKLALNIVGNKMTGQSQDPVVFARQVVASQQNQWGMQGGAIQGGHQRQQNYSDMSNQMDLETKLLRCLDLIDLDDSARVPRYDLKRPTGQTLLHYASALGLTRFVAGLLARGADPNQLDNNGMTPMHFAAMNGQTGIVRRLRLAGADHTIRSLRNYTPADLATSLSVRQATIVSRHHIRSFSAGSTPVKSMGHMRSTSRSFWDNASSQSYEYDTSSESGSDEDIEDMPRPTPLFRVSAPGTPRYLTPSRRGSGSESPKSPPMPTPSTEGLLAPAAAIVAWRDQLATQIQQFQQSVNWLPNLPALPPMPTLPDYQTNPMMRRISSLVPQRTPTPQTAAADARTDSWWDFISRTGNFTTPTSTAPPAYEDLFGRQDPNSAEDLSMKKSSAMQAAADAALDQHYESLASQAGSSTTRDVQIGRTSISRESREQLRAQHKMQLKRVGSDWNLWLVWVPLLIVVGLAILKNAIPEVWHGAVESYGFLRQQYQERVVERVVEVL